MEPRLKRLKNGAYVGVSVVSIRRIPHVGVAGEADSACGACQTIINEISSNTVGQDASFEVIYCSPNDAALQQTQLVCLYLVFRRYGNDATVLKEQLSNVSTHSIDILSSLSFDAEEVSVDDESLHRLLDVYQGCQMASIVRKPKIEKISNRLGCGWRFPALTSDKQASFFNLFEALKSSPGTAVSLSIVPTSFLGCEAAVVHDACFRLETKIQDDCRLNGADEVHGYFNMLRKNIGSQMFLVGINVIGRNGLVETVSRSLEQELQRRFPSVEFFCFQSSPFRSFSIPEFSFYPWEVLSSSLKRYAQEMCVEDDFVRFPFLITREEAYSLFELPYDDGRIRGFEVNMDRRLRTLPNEMFFSDDNIKFGFMKGESYPKAFGVPLPFFTRHSLIVGMPGTGKTTFAVNLLLQMHGKGIPFLAIEPTKTEYRALIDAVPDLAVFTPGQNDVVPFVLNPFLPPSGISLEVFKPSLFSAFKAAFSMPSPLDILFNRAVDECYMQHGWRTYSKAEDEDVEIFGLHEFVLVFKRIIRESSYSRESKNNMEAAGVFRLMNLIVQGGSVYDNIHSVPIEDLLSKSTVIELNAIEDREQKALVMALLLVHIVLYTKHRQKGDGVLKNIILMDEAHVLLGGGERSIQEGNPDAGQATVQALQNMIAEIRSYGTGIVVSDQSPKKVTAEIVGNTDLKMVFQLVQKDDKEMIAKATNMDDGSGNEISRLNTGEAFAYCRGLQAPIKICTSDIRAEKGIRLAVSNDEISSRVEYWNGHGGLLIPYQQCYLLGLCRCCDRRVREDSNYYAQRFFLERRKDIKTEKDVFVCACELSDWMEGVVPYFHKGKMGRLINCTRIKFLRKAAIETDIDLNDRFMADTLELCHREVDVKFGFAESNCIDS